MYMLCTGDSKNNMFTTWALANLFLWEQGTCPSLNHLPSLTKKWFWKKEQDQQQ